MRKGATNKKVNDIARGGRYALVAMTRVAPLNERTKGGLGVAAGLAASVTVLPFFACIVAGAAIGMWYYNKHHPSQLEPSSANDAVVAQPHFLSSKWV
jgi:hypothetical protein